MKIGLLTIPGLRVAGGGERLIVETADKLRKLGHETAILTPAANKEALYGYENLRIIKLKLKRFRQILEIRSILKAYNFDTLISYSSDTYALWATLGLRIPYFVHINGSPFWFIETLERYAYEKRPIFDTIYNSVLGYKEFIKKKKFKLSERLKAHRIAVLRRFALQKSAKTMTLTDQVKWELKLIYGVDAVVIRPGITLNTKMNKAKNIKDALGCSGKKMILSISRLDCRKRIGLLIEAFNKIAKERHDVIMVIGGTGPEENVLRDLVSRYKIQSKVVFTGYIPEDHLQDYYYSCDIFAYPAWCAYGLAPLEALIFNKKCVVSKDALVSEILKDNENVWIVEPSLREFKLALEKALDKPTKSDDKISSIIVGFTWENFAKKVEKVILNNI